MEEKDLEVMENEAAEQMEDEVQLSPTDVLMFRFSEIDEIIRNLGYDGAIMVGNKDSFPRYSIRREGIANTQEISIFLRDTPEEGSAFLALVTRIPFGDHSVDEIYDVVADVAGNAGISAFSVNTASKEIILKASLTIGGEFLRPTQIKGLLDRHHVDEKNVMERIG